MSHQLELKDKGKLCFYDGKYVNLSAREYNLLKFLVDHPNEVMSHDEIREQVWPGSDNNINTVMSRIRQKVPGVEIITRNNMGYGYII